MLLIRISLTTFRSSGAGGISSGLLAINIPSLTGLVVVTNLLISFRAKTQGANMERECPRLTPLTAIKKDFDSLAGFSLTLAEATDLLPSVA
jgi:hypothetical protein